MITEGRWDASKKAARWEYEIALECSVCGRSERLSEEVGGLDEGVAIDVGGWRVVGNPQHGTREYPLSPATLVVCCQPCLLSLFDSVSRELYPKPTRFVTNTKPMRP